MQSLSNGALFELKRAFMPHLLKIKKNAQPTTRQRWLRRNPLDYSQRESLTLQQWWWDGLRGEWRDVEVTDDVHSDKG
jgi:hypothetical protein